MSKHLRSELYILLNYTQVFKKNKEFSHPQKVPNIYMWFLPYNLLSKVLTEYKSQCILFNKGNETPIYKRISKNRP